MFIEWLERMMWGFLFALVAVLVLLTLWLIGLVWYIIYQSIQSLAIIILIVGVGIPLGTLLYTIYDNWSYVSTLFEEKKRKWENRNV